MASISVPHTSIVPGTLYTLPTFQAITGLQRAAMRAARSKGLNVRRLGTRGFILGEDFIEFLKKETGGQQEAGRENQG